MYSYSEVTSMLGLKRKQLNKLIKALEAEGYKFRKKDRLTENDYLILCELKDESEAEQQKLTESVKRVISGNLVTLPVVEETIPQDGKVTNEELLKTIHILHEKTTGRILDNNLESLEEFEALKELVYGLKDENAQLKSELFAISKQVIEIKQDTTVIREDTDEIKDSNWRQERNFDTLLRQTQAESKRKPKISLIRRFFSGAN